MVSNTGAIKWSKVYGAFSDEYFNDVVEVGDSSLVACGHTGKAFWYTGEGVVVKMKSTTGDVEWAVQITDSVFGFQPINIIQTDDDGFLVTGNGKNNSGYQQIFLVKLDAQGTMEWKKILSYPNMHIQVNASVQLADSSFVIGGTITGDMPYMAGISPSGNLVWSRSYDVMASLDGMVRTQSGLVSLLRLSGSAKIMHTDHSGMPRSVISLQRNLNCAYPYLYYNYKPGMTLTTDSNLVIIGYEDRYNGSEFIKTNLQGVGYSYSVGMVANGVKPLEDGGVLLTGYGPMYGIKTNSYDLHTGLVRTKASMDSVECEFGSWALVTAPDTLSTDTLMFDSTELGQVVSYTPVVRNIVTDEYAGCVGVLGSVDEKQEAMLTMSVYPNPSSGILQVQVDEHEPVVLEVYNSLGVRVAVRQLNPGVNELDLGSQPKGIYFYRARTEQGASSSGRMVLE
ncbi:MAG: T9SS type A sorting domain-containing protein [Flavobacteriales bacterium]|nr:T9SS type A sorting domain-containing protein [Flavobacteriales bacterium]